MVTRISLVTGASFALVLGPLSSGAWAQYYIGSQTGWTAHKIDEMVRQSPERAYDIAFFDEFARAAGWAKARLSQEPRIAPAELITGLSAFAARICTPAMPPHLS
jgi:hypothetical protein